jgi:hypothetical protein
MNEMNEVKKLFANARRRKKTTQKKKKTTQKKKKLLPFPASPLDSCSRIGIDSDRRSGEEAPLQRQRSGSSSHVFHRHSRRRQREETGR